MDSSHEKSLKLNEDGKDIVSYEPYWTAHSEYTPLRDPSQEPDPAKGSGSMLPYFTVKLGRQVVGIEPKILGHGVYNVVRRSCALAFCLSFNKPISFPHMLRSMVSCYVIILILHALQEFGITSL